MHRLDIICGCIFFVIYLPWPPANNSKLVAFLENGTDRQESISRKIYVGNRATSIEVQVNFLVLVNCTAI